MGEGAEAGHHELVFGGVVVVGGETLGRDAIAQAAYGVGFEAAVVDCPVVALLEERTDDVGHLGVVDILVIEGVEILEVGIREVYRVGVVLRVVERPVIATTTDAPAATG